MSQPPATDNPDDRAAYWDARLRSPTCSDEDRAAFAHWRDADPANAEAVERLRGLIRALYDAYPTEPALRRLRDAAVGRRWPGRTAPIAAGVAALAVAIGVAFLAWSGGGQAPVREAQASSYQTGRGQRTSIRLSDGSHLTLNADTRIEVNFAAGKRSVRLLEGQALFDVAKDRSRPFVVAAGARTVTAVGTTFDVRLDSSRLVVTMVEGKVRVQPIDGSPRAPLDDQILVSGQRLVAARGGALQVSPVDPALATSWSKGRVIFQDTRLAEAVAEINRYSDTRFELSDPSLTEIRVSGMLRTDQPDDFVQALAAYLPIELHKTRNGVTLTRRRGAS